MRRLLLPVLVAAAVSVVAGFAGAPSAAAEPLLTPVLVPTGARTARAVPGMSRVQPLVLGRAALADLRTRAVAALEAFPLGTIGTVTLELTRFHPFAPDAHLEIVEATGVRALVLPDRAYFRGVVRGKAGSRALVIAAPDAVQGLVSVDGSLYAFGSDGAGAHRGYALADVDPAAYTVPGALCANELGIAPRPHAPPVASAPSPLMATDTAPLGTLRVADLAIDTDQELRAKFASDEAALDYLAALIAAVNVIYERDLDVRLSVSWLRLWGAAPADPMDPWTKTDPTDALIEVFTFWNNPFGGMYSIERALVEFISGKPVRGGSTFPNELCDWYNAFGVSQVNGAYDLSDPLGIWDVLVVAHEIGHTFGSTHTHCYDPPVDHCFHLEQGCYSGTPELSQGTVMSYCYLQPGGLANIDLEFGPVVSATIKAFVAGLGGQTCLATAPADPVCGNGAVESGEACDDGGTVAGDCCGAACQFEAAASPCADDGNVCSDDQCDGAGACTHPFNTAPCDDGSACTSDDVCGGGTCSGTATVVCDPCLACTADGGCAVPSFDGCEPAAAKKARLVIKNRTPDAKDTLVWKWQGANPIAKTAFGAPPLTDDVTLCLYDQSGGVPTVRLAARVPTGGDCGGKPCWKERKSGFSYADKSATRAGITRVLLTAGRSGRATIAVAGKGAGLLLPTGPLVAPVVVRFERGQADACFATTYETPKRNDAGEFRGVSP